MRASEDHQSEACQCIFFKNKGQIIPSHNFHKQEGNIMPGKLLWALGAAYSMPMNTTSNHLLSYMKSRQLVVGFRAGKSSVAGLCNLEDPIIADIYLWLEKTTFWDIGKAHIGESLHRQFSFWSNIKPSASKNYTQLKNQLLMPVTLVAKGHCLWNTK